MFDKKKIMDSAIPVIQTQRLHLSGITTEDATDIYTYASDPEVAKNTSWTRHNSITDTINYINIVRSRTSSEPNKVYFCWAIRFSENDVVIGTIDFIQSSPTLGRIDFALARNYWNQGIITEATHSVLNWAFSHAPNLEIIESGGLTENHGTGRVLEKCGMVVKRRFDYRVRKLGGIIKEVTEYQITKENWQRKIVEHVPPGGRGEAPRP